MTKQVIFSVNDQDITFEVTDSAHDGEAFAAGAEQLTVRAQKPFEASVELLKTISSKFVDVLSVKQVKEAEISLGLKVTAKGDFIIIGSSGEASLNLKLKLERRD